MKVFWSIVVFVMIFAGGACVFLKQNPHDFKAKSINGDVTLKNFDGKNKIVYFGYGTCPDICPATLVLVSNALNEIKTDDTVVLFITLDPDRDSVESVDEYAKYFYPNSYGLVVNDLDKVTKNYGAKYQKVRLEKSALEYSVAHSSSLYLLDKNGKFVSEVSNLTPKNIKDSIEELIKN
ncbi:SCO family protein [Campylobacter sp. RM16192]|uniref:SCO family protein n=1 Tax=Campylobacter sp. RM16192 TaxID=1660080 RepID=UPI0014523A4C|nr:SCO family protein [Campylobacter sp. RM16192]QCD53126.1 cytochrome oxidase biogenesis protein, Sco1/SenC/PrrC family [Campylobacter sp. RM16192]